MFRFLFLLLFFPLFVSAQQEEPKDTTEFSYKIGISGYYNRTSTSDALISNYNGNLTRVSNKTDCSLSTTYLWGVSNNILSNDDFFGNLFLDFRKKKKTFIWTMSQFDRSFSLNIRYRVQTGGGLGFYLLRDENNTISITNGFLYDASNINDVVRNSCRLKISKKHKHYKFETVGFYQPALSDEEDYIIKINTSLDIKIKHHTYLQFVFQNNQSTKTNKSNLLYTIGINYQK